MFTKADRRPIKRKSLEEVDQVSTQTFEEIRHKEENRERMVAACRTLLECIGEDADREGLAKTPERMAKSLLYLTSGYEKSISEVVNGALFSVDSDDMILVRDIPIYSLCEHHLLPFLGVCHIGYIPNGKILGLSKLSRIADIFCRRLQVQERLTRQIADAIMTAVDPHGCGVMLECSHMCMELRGIEKSNTKTVSSSVAGVFRDDPKTRQEFFSLIRK
eukprot:TRINITY_DN7701_c0_g2_i2.p1 TRINITY_DN7701_c0_g2~~TRINITY_DN7701_c0_g2_i2.p1  ORF type:complete len:219 (+),score=33.47 TRINITY_DN7701_c0_g2_i2:206-862(+)